MAQPETGPLGILGGTFDPVHFGHLRLAQEAIAALGLSSVLWIPAGTPPHRAPPVASGQHRLTMARLALTGNGAFRCDDGEVARAAPSYTVETLERLRQEYGAARPLVLLLGTDAFLGLAAWHRWREMFSLAHIAVAARGGYGFAPEKLAPPLAAEFLVRRGTADTLRAQAAGLIVSFEMTPLDISASKIRALLGAAASPRYLLPDPVLDYIGRNRLYAPEPHGY